MDILKLLLCVMLLLLYQNCSAEKTTKKDTKNVKQKDLRRSHTPRARIIEEDIKPNSKETHVNDKTDMNIKITPKPPGTKTSTASRGSKHPKNTLLDQTNSTNIHPIDDEKTTEKVMKAIHIPLDLLLKDHSKDNSTVETKSNINAAESDDKKKHKNKESESEVTEPSNHEIDIDVKTDKEKKNTAESRIAPKIVEDHSVIEDELDIRLGKDCVDKLINLIPHIPKLDPLIKNIETIISKDDHYPNIPLKNEIHNIKITPKNVINTPDFTQNNEIYNPDITRRNQIIPVESNQENATWPHYETEKGKFSINYSTNDNATLKEQIDSQATKIEIMINHLPSNTSSNNPFSTIVIRNNTYQEVTEPLYKYPYWYPSYGNSYTYQSNECNQYGNKCWPRYYTYPYYNDNSNKVWKTWTSMDIRVSPNERYCERFNRQRRTSYGIQEGR